MSAVRPSSCRAYRGVSVKTSHSAWTNKPVASTTVHYGTEDLLSGLKQRSPAQIRIKIDPYNLRQKCSPIILVSGNLGLMGIFAGVPLGGGLK